MPTAPGRFNTDRKRAEAAAAHLSALVQSSDDAIIGKDLNGLVTSWNPGAENMFGFSAAEMIGQPIMRLIPLDRQAEELSILDKISRGENVRHFETLRLRKDGNPIQISVTVSPIRDPSGAIVGASKVARDISERKLAEKHLRQSEERFTKAFRSGPAALSLARVDDGKIIEVNDRFENSDGVSPR